MFQTVWRTKKYALVLFVYAAAAIRIQIISDSFCMGDSKHKQKRARVPQQRKYFK